MVPLPQYHDFANDLLYHSLQYFGSESVVKPYNPYAGRSESTVGYSARLESSGLDRGLSSMSMADAGRMASIGRTPSMR